jgi:hypothetical protein
VSTISPQGVAARKPKFLDQMRTFMRARRYSRRTEQAYVDWVRRFILFHDYGRIYAAAEKQNKMLSGLRRSLSET